jgi:hypothetical protein
MPTLLYLCRIQVETHPDSKTALRVQVLYRDIESDRTVVSVGGSISQTWNCPHLPKKGKYSILAQVVDYELAPRELMEIEKVQVRRPS